MKIEGLRSETKDKRARIAATVRWEDCDRPEQELYFETEEAFARSLSCNPHAFLVGCVIPAMHYGEERVAIDAEICPELLDGLRTAMSWIRHWYYEPDRKLVHIEAKTSAAVLAPQSPERAGFFFSGGIDSLATFCANRNNFPLEHPWSIKDGLFVYGLEIDDPEAFEHALDSVSMLAQDASITLIPVYTNLYLNYRHEDAKGGFSFWYYQFQGAALSAIAHAFSRRLNVVSIAASDDIPTLTLLNRQHLKPQGSHPLLDPNYSSSNLRIRHDGIASSRLDRVKLVASWDVARQHLKVCNQYRRYQPDRVNCGRCEKCVRTMLELLAVGALDQTCAFPMQDVSSKLVDQIRIKPSVKNSYTVEHNYLELIPPLIEKGRHDLVRAIERKLAECHNRQKIENWKERIKRFDHQYLKGNLIKYKKLVLS